MRLQGQRRRVLRHLSSDENTQQFFTPEKLKALELEHNQMSAAAEKLLTISKDDHKMAASTRIYEWSSALTYWSSARPAYIEQNKDNTKIAFQLIDQLSKEQLKQAVTTDSSSVGTLIDLMEQSLVAFRGTQQMLQKQLLQRRFHASPELLLQGLQKASRVMDLIDSLEPAPNDHLLAVARMNLWSKRVLYLEEHGWNDVSTEPALSAFGEATNVQDCIDKMQSIYDQHKSVSTLTIFITAYIHSGLAGALDRASDLLQDVDEQYFSKDLTAPFKALMYGYASQKEAAKALFVWEHMKASQITRDEATVATLLLAFTNSGQVEKAHRLLEQMESDDQEVSPNTVCYNIILDAYAKKGKAREAEGLLLQLQESETAAPDRISYTSVIDAYSKLSGEAAGEKAEAILLQCAENNLDPDIVMYNAVLAVWAKQGGGQRAQQLLRKMVQVEPDLVSYNTVLDAWAKTGNSTEILEECQALFDEMKGIEALVPDVVSYNVLLSVVVRSSGGDCFEKVDSLFSEMKEQGVERDTGSYNILMDSIIKSGRPPQEAEDILDRLENGAEGRIGPDSTSYNVVMNAYAKHKDPINAERIFNRMVGQPNRNADEASFSTLMDAWAKSGSPDASDRVLSLHENLKTSGALKPTTITYNVVINALSKSKSWSAALRAEEILNQMQEEYQQHGNSDARPDGRSFSSVINCWAQIGEAERAEEILRRMKDLSQNDRHHLLKPNVITYTTVIHAWSRSQSDQGALRALKLLGDIEDEFAKGQSDVQPNSVCFNATINAIAKTRNFDNKSEQALDILNRMKKAYEDGNIDAAPTAISYASVLNACASSYNDKRKAFEIARNVLKELLSETNLELTSICFVNFLSVCGRLLPQGDFRDQMASATFRECHHRGLVTDKLISGLRKCVSRRTFHETMSRTNVNFQEHIA